MRWRFGLIVVVAVGMVGATAAAADYNRTFEGALADPLGNLPYLVKATPWQVSSFDRTGGNNDGFDGSYSFLRTTKEGEYVIFDEEGPGMVGHIWFTAPAPAERIRFYFDGERSPRVDLPIHDLFNGTRFPFLRPIVGDDSYSSGGFYLYLPFHFRKSLRIATTGNPRFYHITYLKFDDSRGVSTFDPDFRSSNRLLLEATVGRWERRGDPAMSLPPDCQVTDATAALKPGEQTAVFEAAGSGMIDGLVVKVDPELDWSPLGGVRLLGYWDGATEPSVDAPLREFFGTCFQPVRYAALPLGMSEDRFYSFFRMPHRFGARLVIENGSEQELPEMRFRIFHRPLPRLPGRIGRFHAQGREEFATAGKPIEILRRAGKGHYVGVTMSIRKADGTPKGEIGFLEGDEQIYVDGDPRPHLHGTGTEDYFNGGWYFNRGTFSLPFHGHHYRDVPAGEIAVYRFHVLDPVPFQREIQAFIEHGPGNDRVGTRYRLVAYWYEDPLTLPGELTEPIYRPMETLTVVPPLAEGGKLRQLAPKLKTSGDALEFTLLEVFDPSLTGGHLLRFAADAPGDFLELTPPTEIPDRYSLRSFHCRGPALGKFRLEVNGQPQGAEIDGYTPQFEPNVETDFGEIPLDRESVTVRLVVTGRNPLAGGYGIALTGLDLHSLSRYVDKWWVLGPFDDEGHGYFDSVTDIERGKLDLTRTYQGKDGQEFRWRKTTAEDGIIDLDKILGETDDAVAYALTYLHAERESDPGSRLMLGSDDGVRVYVGGKQLYEKRVTRGLNRDEDVVPVKYGKGITPILVKIYDGKGAWSLAARLNDPHGALRYEYE